MMHLVVLLMMSTLCSVLLDTHHRLSVALDVRTGGCQQVLQDAHCRLTVGVASVSAQVTVSKLVTILTF